MMLSTSIYLSAVNAVMSVVTFKAVDSHLWAAGKVKSVLAVVNLTVMKKLDMWSRDQRYSKPYLPFYRLTQIGIAENNYFTRTKR